MTKANKTMWELLVPTVFPDTKKPIKTKYHRVWDEKVRDVAGGMTILRPAKGHWISPKGEIYTERMIPVKILATREDIEKIIDFTIEYYRQEAVLAYKISDEYIMRHKNEN